MKIVEFGHKKVYEINCPTEKRLKFKTVKSMCINCNYLKFTWSS